MELLKIILNDIILPSVDRFWSWFMTKFRPVRTFRANGKRYKLKTVPSIRRNGEDYLGEVDHDSNTVIIHKENKEESLLDTRIHEFVHCFFDAGNQSVLHEETVNRFSTELACFLWRLRYRCPDDDDDECGE